MKTLVRERKRRSSAEITVTPSIRPWKSAFLDWDMLAQYLRHAWRETATE
jgi:hypothetical protein